MKPKNKWYRLLALTAILFSTLLFTGSYRSIGVADKSLPVVRQAGSTMKINSAPGVQTPLSIDIYAVQQECSYGWAGGTISGGTPPYTTSWEISIDGGSYQSFTDPIFYINCKTNLFANFHCTVTDAASNTADDYYHLEIDPNYPD